ncbi:hypothetical protein BKP35_04785 [Anaerobacillus arseniciselenatis]|uniref:Cytoplasmic protein n=2 Tax=Anaerobacillus arseniciselenatis TaxID=85682 RepID=A0A1S2LUF5_9BACI|nr:hypothetical protein BKP35_04785 [Anaerobacillus arseniciselenatis]
MEMKKIKILGEGSSSGGEFEKVQVIGQGEIGGDVKAKITKITGECHIKGNALIDQYNLTGKGIIDGELECEEVKVIGDLTVTDSLKATIFNMRGFVTSNGNAEMEKMTIKGGFHIEGLMNVGELSVNLQVANSKVQEIGGENITIKSKSLFNKTYTLEAEIIEGDNIYLEYTTANVVRGNDVEIGPGCEIKFVEYRSTFKCSDKNTKKIAEVKQI